MPSKTTRLLLAPAVLVAAAASLLLGSASAQAAETVTFGLAGGSLAVTSPGTNAAPPNGAAGAPLDVPLGTITVTDTRGTADTTWAASVISTDFTTGLASTTETVAAALIGYRSGASTATTGSGGTTAGGTIANISAAGATAFSHGAGTGSNSLSWSPTLVVNIPLENEAGTYTGIVTHSVA